MTSKNILYYAIKGLHQEIRYKEKEIKRINGAIYALKNDIVLKGKYINYTLNKLKQLRNEYKQDLKHLKSEYNTLIYNVDRQHLKVVYIENEVA